MYTDKQLKQMWKELADVPINKKQIIEKTLQLLLKDK